MTGGTDGLGNLPILYLSWPLGHLSWPLGLQLSKRPLTLYYFVAGGRLPRGHRDPSRAALALRARHPRRQGQRAAGAGLWLRHAARAAGGLPALRLLLRVGGRADHDRARVRAHREHPLGNVGDGADHDALRRHREPARSLRGLVGVPVDARLPSKKLEYWEIFVGGAFVLIVLFLPEGIVGTLRRMIRAQRPLPPPLERPALAPTADHAPAGAAMSIVARVLKG